MEKKLAEYRSKKQLEEKRDQTLVSETQKTLTFAKKPQLSPECEVDESAIARDDLRGNGHTQAPSAAAVSISKSDRYLAYASSLLKFALWLVLLILFAKLEFGAVFFVLSLIYFMFTNLRSSKSRKPGELSAYSVFNPNFEKLEGTLTAEQFEREIRRTPF